MRFLSFGSARIVISLSLASMFFCSALSVLAEPTDGAQSASYSALNGKTIRSIRVHVRDIFDEENLSALYRFANSLKVNTKEQVVLRELLFKEGDSFDDFVLQESERNLRLLGFLREVRIVPKADGDSVDVDVYSQDTWTIIPQFSFTSGTGNQKLAAGLAENNLLGLGKRVEALYEEDRNRSSYSALYDDPRVWGTLNRALVAHLERTDGDETLFLFGRPFRSLVDKFSWETNLNTSNTIGRLFENGDERFIFRQRHTDLGLGYTMAHGDPKVSVGRYSLGYRYQDDRFSDADAGDYADLSLNPNNLSHDPDLLADLRRFTGPSFGYEQVEPDFIKMTYIDRFEYEADYNLGNDLSLTGFAAPGFMGSSRDTFLFSGNDSVGYRFSNTAFVRGELGGSTRVDDDGLANSIVRTEIKFYDVLGLLELGNLPLGRHTLAANLTLDIGSDLDRDREFLLGADTGLRGYTAKTFTGDRRLVFNLEDRVHIADDVFKLVSVGAAAFFDAGGSTRESLGELIGSHMYSDVGVGLRFAFPRTTGGRVFRIDLAFPLRDGPDGSNSFEPRLILTGGQLFGSYLRSETDGPERASVGIGFDR
ncbi:MAG: hypothetical protein K1X79_11000 [Oligoflexia bacterium]|nr:hypothetical protein [Oligoflexia bacterium]